MKALLDVPLLLKEQYSVYVQDYDSTNMGPKQWQMFRRFRYDFLKWYEKRKCKGDTLLSFAFHPTGHKWSTFWTTCVPDENIPKKTHMVKTKNRFKKQQLPYYIPKNSLKTKSPRILHLLNGSSMVTLNAGIL
jgi:hypothetical protein